jgi:hypothetical protein
VVGAVTRVELDHGATPIDSSSGAGSAQGDIAAADTLAAFARTTLAAVGGDPGALTSPGGTAKVISSALA